MALTMLRWFFFSSRRRHTRCSRDWSSDVCSSDLDRSEVQASAPAPRGRLRPSASHSWRRWRSEERRVGKECRSRWWPCHQKKKNEQLGPFEKVEVRKNGGKDPGIEEA